MATDAADVEEIAVALPFSRFELYLVVIVIAAEGDAKLVELKTFRFLGIPLGLLDFPDHSIVHRRSPWKKKARWRKAPCLRLAYKNFRSTPLMAVLPPMGKDDQSIR
jgi:hypothetical protein